MARSTDNPRAFRPEKFAFGAFRPTPYLRRPVRSHHEPAREAGSFWFAPELRRQLSRTAPIQESLYDPVGGGMAVFFPFASSCIPAPRMGAEPSHRVPKLNQPRIINALCRLLESRPTESLFHLESRVNQGAPDPPLTALVWLRSLNKVETGHRPEENHPIEQVRPLRFLQNRKEETDLTSLPTRARTSGGMSRSRTLTAKKSARDGRPRQFRRGSRLQA